MVYVGSSENSKDYGRANRGKTFEDFLKLVHGLYQADGTACVHKVPTEFIPIRDGHGRIVSCKVEEKSCVDYLGRYRDIPVAVEAKHEKGNRISFGRVEQHQAAYMDDFTGDPGAAGIVVVSFGMERFFAVPWVFWKAAMGAWERKEGRVAVRAYGWEWETPGMASASPEQLHPEWEIEAGGAYGLPYLGIADRMMMGKEEEG